MRTLAFTNDTINKELRQTAQAEKRPELARFLEFGSANGYVAVPPEHPYYGKGYEDDDIYDLSVHGGITFAAKYGIRKRYGWEIQKLNNDVEPQDDWWVFGFDTLHYGDNAVNWSIDKVEAETLRLQEQLEAIWQQ
jgi:hypothetical protein